MEVPLQIPIYLFYFIYLFEGMLLMEGKNSGHFGILSGCIVTSDNYNVQNTEEQPPDITGMYCPIAFIYPSH